MATASASPSPNPNALKFELSVTLPETVSFKSKDEAEAAGNDFCAAILEAEGVVSVFGTNDFVTVTRRPEVPWDRIIEAVQAAAMKHL
jgi:hypothetical protein